MHAHSLILSFEGSTWPESKCKLGSFWSTGTIVTGCHLWHNHISQEWELNTHQQTTEWRSITHSHYQPLPGLGCSWAFHWITVVHVNCCCNKFTPADVLPMTIIKMCFRTNHLNCVVEEYAVHCFSYSFFATERERKIGNTATHLTAAKSLLCINIHTE